MSKVALPEIDVWLASRSPRRRELLKQVGLDYGLVDIEIDETPLPNEDPADYVERLAIAKSRAGADHCREQAASIPVLGADTTVTLDGDILGKPADLDDAAKMLRALSGREHEVLTAIALSREGQESISAVSRTRIWFRALSTDEIHEYWQSGEPQDKAGAYAIQGLGGMFVERMEGSYSGVVGLPLFELWKLLQELDTDAVQRKPES